MFQKKEIIFSDTIGVCMVADVTKLGLKNEKPIPYYLLRSVKDQKKISYIPVKEHKVTLRNLITLEEAKILQADGSEKSQLVQEEIDYVIWRSGQRLEAMKRKEETHV